MKAYDLKLLELAFGNLQSARVFLKTFLERNRHMGPQVSDILGLLATEATEIQNAATRVTAEVAAAAASAAPDLTPIENAINANIESIKAIGTPPAA